MELEEEEETISFEFLEEEQSAQYDEELLETPRTQANYELLQAVSSVYFLDKHSPSFKCFEQALCSTSDLKLTLNFFPPLVDPGLDDALNFIPPEDEALESGVDKYVKMCKTLTIVPIQRVINGLNAKTLDLKYYGLSLKQMRGITAALKVNSTVKNLILQDNFMSVESTALISEILQENNSIVYLNLKECRIGPDGAQKLNEGIPLSSFLQELDLSYNSLGDKGFEYLHQGLIENSSIKKLNLSRNELTEDSAPLLQLFFTNNMTVEELDLSWNGFYTEAGNKRLCRGLLKNEQIKSLSLAWNGIGTAPAIQPITRWLRRSKIIEFLDLSWNRITQKALSMLKRALIRNKSLFEVKVGHNIYTPDEAYFLTELFKRAKNDLCVLNMEDMCVKKEFLALKERFRKKNKSIIHGHVLSNYEIKGPNLNKLLFNRCKYLGTKPKKKKKKKDFGHFILSLPDSDIKQDDFLKILKKQKIKLVYKDKDLLAELMKRFEARKKQIDCVGLKAAFMELYPDTVPPPQKKKKKKKKKGKGKKKKKK